MSDKKNIKVFKLLLNYYERQNIYINVMRSVMVLNLLKGAER